MVFIARAVFSVENAWASGIWVVRQVRSELISWLDLVEKTEGRYTHHAIACMADVFPIDEDHGGD